MTNEAYFGIVRGKIVELTDDPGLAQGQRVEVVIRPVTDSQSKVSAAGMLADVPNLDKSIREVEQYRKLATYRTDSL